MVQGSALHQNKIAPKIKSAALCQGETVMKATMATRKEVIARHKNKYRKASKKIKV